MAKVHSLAANTCFLYILTFSNYIFGLITLPYETRVLGPEYFGILGFAAAFYNYFYIIFDFGFILCGTKKITECHADKDQIGRILSGITLSKFFLFLLTALLFFAATFMVERLKEYSLLLFLYLVYAALTCFIPDFLYRGLENMKMITYRTVLVRFIFTCLIFVFLKRPEQIYMIPLFNIVGTLCALLWIYYDIRYKLGIRFCRVSFRYCLSLLKESSNYFLSRIASTIYGATNMLILGFVYPASNILGYYTSVEKIKSLASQAASPIADSFYPYMIRTKDYRKLFKVTALFESMIIIGCVVLWIFSEQFCNLIFGPEFIEAGHILRYMIPLMAIILPVYMFGFPALSPIGMAKWANNSVIIAMVNQILGVVILFITHNVTPYSIIVLTIISEIICLIVRISALLYQFKKNIQTESIY